MRSNPPVYQIKVTLVDSDPSIWRRILLPSDLSLPELHELLQIAMGWENYHLHQFTAGTNTYGVPDPHFPSDIVDETDIRVEVLLPGVGASAVYEYDFGDRWQHELVVEEVLDPSDRVPLPRCLEGERACPPEDCGGIFRYQHLIETARGPNQPEYQELTQWLGENYDPAQFDRSIVNFILGSVFG